MLEPRGPVGRGCTHKCNSDTDPVTAKKKGASLYASLIPGRANQSRDQLTDFVYNMAPNTLYTEGRFESAYHLFSVEPSVRPNAYLFIVPP